MDVLISKKNCILTITFNRPDKKNAITAAMYQTIADALKDAECDAGVRAILFTGEQEIFTAGNDLDDFLKKLRNLTFNLSNFLLMTMTKCTKLKWITANIILFGRQIKAKFNCQ